MVEWLKKNAIEDKFLKRDDGDMVICLKYIGCFKL